MKKYIKSSDVIETPKTFDDLAKLVADDFVETMKDFDFETFDEMVQVYWWTSKDIKEEVASILTSISNNMDCDAFIDEYDGKDVFLNGDIISYRTFSRLFRKYIQAAMNYKESEELEDE